MECVLLIESSYVIGHMKILHLSEPLTTAVWLQPASAAQELVHGQGAAVNLSVPCRGTGDSFLHLCQAVLDKGLRRLS